MYVIRTRVHSLLRIRISHAWVSHYHSASARVQTPPALPSSGGDCSIFRRDSPEIHFSFVKISSRCSSTVFLTQFLARDLRLMMARMLLRNNLKRLIYEKMRPFSISSCGFRQFNSASSEATATKVTPLPPPPSSGKVYFYKIKYCSHFAGRSFIFSFKTVFFFIFLDSSLTSVFSSFRS